MDTEILLARHGETDWNRDNRFQGHADPPLNEAGRRQAAELAARLAAGSEAVDAVYTSDLVRAHETARIVGDRLGLEIVVVPDLREVDVGPWSGYTRDEIEERFPDGFRRWIEGGEPDGWEPRERLTERVVSAVERIAAAHPGGKVLVVSHGGALRAVLRHAGAERRPFPNCAVVTVTHRLGGIRVG
jgi:2,3-bisphosphoglycerate-dependent phosphoglycerate mutase